MCCETYCNTHLLVYSLPRRSLLVQLRSPDRILFTLGCYPGATENGGVKRTDSGTANNAAHEDDTSIGEGAARSTRRLRGLLRRTPATLRVARQRDGAQ